MDRFTPSAESALRDAGWRPARRTYVEAWIDHFEERGCVATEAAVDFLVEFGGLDFQIAGRGVDRAREPFDLDPTLCDGNVDRFLDWSTEIGRSLFPIGVMSRDYVCLGIDEFSELYLIESQILSFGRMPQALESLLLGKGTLRQVRTEDE